jgi:hypothetical protein
MSDVGLKIVVGADLSAVTDGMKVAASNVAQFGDIAEKTFSEVAGKVGVAANAFEHAFDEIAAGNAALAKINASIDAAGDAAQQAGAKFDTLGGRLPLQDFNDFKKTIDQFKRDIATGFKVGISGGSIIPPIPPAVVDSFNKTKVGANQAANALTNVGRVAQDLPFGFVGIQNNLNPLLESFQRLKAETGSGKAALSALGQSLLGPAGLGIALSVVSAAIVIFQNGIAGFNTKTKEAKDKTEEFLKTLKSVGEVAAGATGSQAGDISQVQALANVITNTNNAYSERKRALEELKEVNKNYFGDLKLEESQMSILTARVNEYTQAIVAQAVLKGFTDEISRVSVELAKQDNALRKSADEVNRLRTALANTKQSETSLTGEDRVSEKYIRTANALDDANEAFSVQNKTVVKLRSNLNDLQGSIDGAVKETLKFRDLNSPTKQKAGNDGLEKQLSLLEKIRDAQKDFQGKLFDLKDIDEATDKLAALEQQVGDLKLKIGIRDAKKAGLPAADIAKLSDAIKQDTQKRLNEAFQKEALLLEASPKLKFSQPIKIEIPNNVNFFTTTTGTSNFNINDAVSKATGFDKKIPVITLHEARVLIDGKKITAQIEGKEQILAELNKQIGGIFEGGFNDALSGIGDALGEALASSDFGSGLKKAAENILGVVGNVMQQLGKAIIAAAIKIKLLKETLEKWAIANPGLAIIAGIGLVAAGVALKSLKFDGPKFAEGGIATGPVIGQVGERFRPEVILPLDRLPQLFKQIGGDVGGGTQLIPIINNEGLYLAMKRGERSAGRKF